MQAPSQRKDNWLSRAARPTAIRCSWTSGRTAPRSNFRERSTRMPRGSSQRTSPSITRASCRRAAQRHSTSRAETLLPEARIRIASARGHERAAGLRPAIPDRQRIQGSGQAPARSAAKWTSAAASPTRAALELDAVTVDSPTAAISLEGLARSASTGSTTRRAARSPARSTTACSSRGSPGTPAGCGASSSAPRDLPFATTGRHFRVLEPVVLPIFDGGLAIDDAARAPRGHGGDVRALRRGDPADQRRAAVARLRLAGVPGHARRQHPRPAAATGRRDARRQSRGGACSTGASSCAT